MNVLVFASRKGGSGKSTLAAHLATYIASPSRRTLLIDADPQGSLSFWHKIRGKENPALRHGGAQHRRSRQGGEARRLRVGAHRYAAGQITNTVAEAIKQATLVIIPMRPGVFDIAAVQDTVALSRELRKPYAAVINGAPPKRHNQEVAIVADARGALNALKIPVWAGQVTHRADFSQALSGRRGRRGIRGGLAGGRGNGASLDGHRPVHEGRSRCLCSWSPQRRVTHLKLSS